jgi:hypothetical protein
VLLARQCQSDVMDEDGMARECSTHGDQSIDCLDTTSKRETSGKIRRRWGDNIKMGDREIGWEFELNSVV